MGKTKNIRNMSSDELIKLHGKLTLAIDKILGKRYRLLTGILDVERELTLRETQNG